MKQRVLASVTRTLVGNGALREQSSTRRSQAEACLPVDAQQYGLPGKVETIVQERGVGHNTL